MDMYEGRIDLLQYVRAIGKRKWLIGAATIACALLGLVYGFLEPVRWGVDAVIQGGRFFNPEQHVDILIAPAEVLAGQINAGYYQSAIATELKTESARLPGIKAKILRWTERVEVTVKAAEPETGTHVLEALLVVLRRELDRRIDAEKGSQDAQIAQFEKIVQEETDAIQKREAEISALRRSLGAGLENSAIRQLETELGILRIVRETHRKDLQQLKATFAQSEPTHFVRAPVVSPRPVSPRKGFDLLLGGALGLVIFTLFALFLDYVHRTKKSVPSSPGV